AAGTEGTDAAALQVLRDQAAAASGLLGEREPAEEALRQRIALVTAATEAVRNRLQAAAAAAPAPGMSSAPTASTEPAPAEQETSPEPAAETTP
ncbi:MAG TPA: hypothetical protein VM759_10115, partial [Longimicrobium sp.]|nr:hypothetical protein [Longimicrobium sp.]